jgi:hypothetical protein
MRVVSGVLPAFLVFLIGCSSSYDVSSSPDADSSFNAFNEEASERSGTIVFRKNSEVEARNMSASPDSTRFLNAATDSITVVPTHTVKKVVVTNHGAGFVDGLVWGAIVGSVTVAAICAADGGQSIQLKPGGVIFLSLFGGAVGGAIGGVCGVIAGHSYEYQFPASAESTKY